MRVLLVEDDHELGAAKHFEELNTFPTLRGRRVRSPHARGRERVGLPG
ncbi:hypothetical protein ACWGE0_12635 [Lentzea sp. NPDC054927]